MTGLTPSFALDNAVVVRDAEWRKNLGSLARTPFESLRGDASWRWV